MRNWHGNLSPFGQWHTGGRAFTPAVFFGANEPGLWLDPSDAANLSWRRNLLTWTEQFDNAAWTKSGAGVAVPAVVTANAGTAPDGTTTADRIQLDCTNTGSSANRSGVTQGFTATTGTAYTASVYIRAFDAGNVGRTVRIASDFIGSTVYTLTADWQRVVIGGTSSGTVSNLIIETRGTFTQQTADILLWGAQLEVGSTASTYQPITDLNTEVRALFPNATLYQDTAGITPVTTPGQSVALALDKSKGLVLGSELVTNGEFATDTGWTKGTGWTISGGVAAANIATGSNLDQSLTTTINKSYVVTYTITSYTSGGIRARFTGVANISGTIRNAVGTYTEIFHATATNSVFRMTDGGGGFIGSIDNISVKELPGFHATQATAGSRPLYALLPANGVRNLANGSADTTNFSVWATSGTANGITITRSGAGIDVDGLPFADYTVVGTATAADRRFLISSGFRIPASVGRQFAISATVQRTVGSAPPAGCGVALDALGETAPVTYVEGGGNLGLPVDAATATTFTRTYTLANAASNQATGVVTIETANGATVNYTVRIKALQFELGSTRTAYQFNYSNVNIAQPPFAQVGALLFDGVDDFLQTPSVDFAGYEQLGSELVVNGDFSSATGWTQQTGWTIGSGVLTGNVASATFASTFRGIAFTAGQTYSVTFTVTSYTSGEVRAVLGGTTDVFGVARTSAGTFTQVLTAVAGSNSIAIQAGNPGFVGTIDNVSVREVLRPADKMTVFAGVRKLSDATAAIVAELTANLNSNNGAFYVTAPQNSLSANFGFDSKGTVEAVASASGFPSPLTAVLTGIGDISGDRSTLRINGIQVSQVTTDQGTGNYSNAIIYIGRRGGSSVPFNGYLYSLIVRGAATTAAQIAATETWVNSRTGAY